MKKIFTLLLMVVLAFSLSAQKNVFVKENSTKKDFNTKELSNQNFIPSGLGQKAAWDILFSFNANAAAQPGIATDGTNIYTSTWNATTFSRYTMDGTFVEDFTVAGAGSVRDMTCDGQYFYGSAANMTIFKMDFTNETLIASIPVTCSGVTGVRHIAYDPTLDGGNGGFWIGNWTELGAIKMDGSQLIAATATGVADCYGSAFDPYTDPANPRILLFEQNGTGVDIYAYDINTATITGLVHSANDIPGFAAGSIGGGLEVYADMTEGKAILLGNIQQDPNLIFGYELAILADTAAPNVMTNFVVTPGANGALNATATWTNPSINVAGNALDSLASTILKVDGDTIYQNNTPVIGGNENSGLMAPFVAGFHTFTVFGVNDAGTGLPTSLTVYIGEDVPAAPDSLEITLTDATVDLTWVAPTTGLNGGYFSGTGVTYDVLRNGTLVSDNQTATTFTEDLTASGNYTYTVIASNAIGEGGSAESATVVYGYLLYEDFTAAALPSTWTAMGDFSANWLISTTNNAGGLVNEMQFKWSSDNAGTSYYVSPVINTTGMSVLKFAFKHNVNHYGAGYSLGAFTTTDGGTTWNQVWTLTPTASIPATDVEFYVLNTDVGSANFQIAFSYIGDPYQINYWYVDNVTLMEDSLPPYNAGVVAKSMSEYTMIPYSQVPANGLEMGATVYNFGSSDLTNVVLNVTDGVWAGSSSPLSVLAMGTSEDVTTTTNFTPSTNGVYDMYYEVSMTETDADLSDNYDTLVLDIDTTYARDNGIATGTLGIGDGTGGSLGLVYELVNSGIVTSVTFQLGADGVSPTIGATMEVEIFNYDDATGPGTLIYTSPTFTNNSDVMGIYTVDIVDQTLPAGKYLIALHEHADNITLATSPENYTPVTNWVTFTGQAWTPAEQIAPSFGVNYFLRPNISPAVKVNEFDANVVVSPNPTRNILNVSANQNFTVNVIDMTGRIVANEIMSNNSAIIDMSSLQNGMYIVTLTNEKGSLVYKVVKQ